MSYGWAWCEQDGNLQLTVLDAGRIVIERWSIISSESGENFSLFYMQINFW